jgi:hypothetical protein
MGEGCQVHDFSLGFITGASLFPRPSIFSKVIGSNREAKNLTFRRYAHGNHPNKFILAGTTE